MTVLVDTSAIYAAMSDADHNHRTAQQLMRVLVRGRHEMVVASPAMLETVALLQRRRGLDAVSLFRQALAASMDVLWFDGPMGNMAWDELGRVGRRSVSFADCATAVAAEMLDVKHVFAVDPHFEEWGLKLLTVDDLTDADADA